MAFNVNGVPYDFLKNHVKREFTDRKSVYEFLNNKVFTNQDFIEDITDSALILNLPFDVVFIEVANYLTDILYEIDKAITKKRRTKINMFSYLFFRVSKYETLYRGQRLFRVLLQENRDKMKSHFYF